MDKKNWVVQHNALVTARYRLTVEEQRLIKTVVSLIHRNDEDFKSYEIKIAELAKILGIVDASYYSRVKKVIKGILNDRTVLDFVNEHGQEVQTRWLSSAVYSPNEGIVELRFDPVLKPYLLQLKTIFTYYELENILQLRGMYSIRIYELLKQYESIGKREFSLDDFKKILIIEDKYKEYRELKKYVISPAIKEVCEKTDISFSLEEKTKGRKVVGLVFYIQKNVYQ